MIHALGRAVRAGFAVVPLVGVALHAQERPTDPPRIADNSFLVEEAYNQEAGVVQHIGTFRRAPDGAWLFAFTQEWPAPSQRHQLSYTAPLVSDRAGGTGVGDLAINYRYQLAGHDDARVWFAPRLSVILPTGDAATGRGFGGPGVQTNLPLSVELTPTLVTHWNAGAGATRARDLGGTRRTLRSLSAAASTIWLVAPTLNVMLESVWERTEAFDAPNVVRTDGRFTVMPGVRGAINLSSGMQIVPGVGVPFVRSGGRTQHDLFLYLSVEHSFR
jgi:hypothetical protein